MLTNSFTREMVGLRFTAVADVELWVLHVALTMPYLYGTLARSRRSTRPPASSQRVDGRGFTIVLSFIPAASNFPRILV